MKPTVIDLFAGVGGLSLGFEQAGFHVVLANEYDGEIATAYRKNHHETKMVVGDITALDLENTFGVFSGKLVVLHAKGSLKKDSVKQFTMSVTSYSSIMSKSQTLFDPDIL